jgi:hypothetical protein
LQLLNGASTDDTIGMGGFLELVLTPFSAIMARPFLAFVPAAIFATMYWRLHGRTSLAAASAWGLYGVYEYGNYLRLTCSGECNIRVDMLLLAPLLIAISCAALLSPGSPPTRQARP